MITIVDHGLGNIFSVYSAVKLFEKNVQVTNNYKDLKKTSKLILPGVGNFEFAMKNLAKSNLIEVLNEIVLVKKRPVLGICLGCQLLLEKSDESPGIKGLGWIRGANNILPLKNKLMPTPHIGWNEVKIIKNHYIFKDIPKKFYLYFNHSFYPNVEQKYIFAKTEYSNIINTVIIKENIIGVQPHPEKSQDEGIKIIKNFIKNAY